MTTALMTYEAVIGLEVHAQLCTRTKMFCRCRNLFGAPPNTLVCPTCLGFPGTLPVINSRAIDLAIKIALAVEAQIRRCSVFARKNYFYADLPKGYQISQFDKPLAEHGSLPLSRHDKKVRIGRLHLEEDAGKLLHGERDANNDSLVDFNRSGVPLVEIVSEPDMRTPEEAQDYLQSLHQLLLYTGVSDGNMEEGSLRCDANISVRKRGTTALGTKTEVKNLNSFRFVARALDYEFERQIEILESGGRVLHETRTFDASRGVTYALRSKEEAHDYRYFPEPDLPPLRITEERIDQIAREIPELPWKRRKRFHERYGLALEDARLLSSSRQLADYFEAAVETYSQNPRGVANWIKTEVLRELRHRQLEIEQVIPAARLTRLIALVDENMVSSSGGKAVLAEMWDSSEGPEQIAQRLGLIQVHDDTQLTNWAREVLANHPKEVARYLDGKPQLLGFFVGQVMRLSHGKAEPVKAGELLRRLLDRPTP